jgi:hypothetical protein
MPFGSLWLPVVVSAVVVFVASSILHMALRYHKADYKSLPNEGAVREAVGKGDPAPGIYITPHCTDMKQLKDPAVQAQYVKGPIALLTVFPKGVPNMAKHLTLWFALNLLVSFVAAYVARYTLQPGDDGLLVMRITGTVAFASYAVSELSNSIWKGQPWANTTRFLLDGAIYALLTGLTFQMMWPAA